MISEEQIEKLLKEKHINAKVTHLSEKSLGLEYEGTLTFKHLDIIHELFKTEQINLNSETKQVSDWSGGYYNETITKIYIRNYKLDFEIKEESLKRIVNLDDCYRGCLSCDGSAHCKCRGCHEENN